MRLGRFARVGGWLLSAGVAIIAIVALKGRYAGVTAAGGLPGTGPVLIAIAANVVANGVLVTAWRSVLTTADVALAWRPAAWVWAISQIARYTLGAAQVGGRAVAGRRWGVTAAAGAVTTLVEVAWATAINAVLVLSTLPWWLPGAQGLRWLAVAGLAPAAVLAVGLVDPQRLLRWTAQLLGWGPVARLTKGKGSARVAAVGLDRRGAARITGLYLANSAVRLGAFLVLLDAVGGSVGRDGLRAVGAFAVGQVVGRLAVFAPGGLGPREGATAAVLAPVVGGSATLVLVAAVRLVEIAGELLFLAVARARRPVLPSNAN